ncbi:MAG: S8 family serine peptidase [Muribaculaceae bacterium]|nr:S8 family serine peptidase [Muribaculaceae bacterium]
MKKYFLQKNGQLKRPHYPFWKPWGCLGCLGRVIGFLICLALFLLLLLFFTSLPRCSGHGGSGGNDSIINDTVPPGPEPAPNPILPIHDSVPDNIVAPPEPVPNRPDPFVPDPDDIIDNPDGPGKIDARHLFVIVDEGRSSAKPALDRFVQEFKAMYPDCTVEAVSEPSQMVLLGVPAERRERIRQELPSRITDVAFHVDVVEIFGGAKEISDPAMQRRETSWHLREVLAPEGWDVTTGNSAVKVAVIDNYFDLSHPDFRGMKIENPISFEKGTTDVAPPDGDMSQAHGTHVLGLIGAQMNGIGTAGVAPDCTFMPISLGKAMNSFTIIEAVLYALHNGATVINASLGHLPNENIDIREQVRRWLTDKKRLQGSWDYVSDMLDRGYCTIVWASGNENLFEMMDFAKRSPNVIRVDAVTPGLKKASFSNFGNFDFDLDGQRHEIRQSQISAPGQDVVSTVPGRKFAPFAGTSMAAPIVTGAVALMKSLDPTLTNAEIVDILKTTGKPLSNDSIGPLLQIRPALDAVRKNLTGWDEFKKDPVNAGGIWKKTDQSTYVDSKTNEFRYYGHDYLIFETRDSGVFEIHVVGTDRVYNARFNVKWGDDEAIVEIIPPLIAPDSPSGVTTRKIRLYKDKDGQIGYEIKEPVSGTASHLKLLRKDDRVNTNKRKI